MEENQEVKSSAHEKWSIFKILTIVLGLTTVVFLTLFLLKNAEAGKTTSDKTKTEAALASCKEENANLRAEKEALISENGELTTEKEQLSAENETLRSEKEKLIAENEELQKDLLYLIKDQAASMLDEKKAAVQKSSEQISAKLSEVQAAREDSHRAQTEGNSETAQGGAARAQQGASVAAEFLADSEIAVSDLEEIQKALEGSGTETEEKASAALAECQTLLTGARVKVEVTKAFAALAQTDACLAKAQAEKAGVGTAPSLEDAKKAAEAARTAAADAGTAVESAKSALQRATEFAEALAPESEARKTANAYLEMAKNAVAEAESQSSAAAAAADEADAACKERENPTYTPESVLANAAGTVVPEEAVDAAKLSSYFQLYEIDRDGEVFNRINGKSYQDNPDIGLEQLRYLKVLHRNYNGEIQVGELICSVSVAQDLLAIFRELYEDQYQIYSMYLVDKFWTGDALTTDEASVRANNTSAFSYRRASDADNLSNHALGKAIDINPRHNPYVVLGEDGWYTDPHIDYEAGEEGYANPDTRAGLPHAMTENDACVRIFKSHGFTWGGDMSGASRDFQHFERLG